MASHAISDKAQGLVDTITNITSQSNIQLFEKLVNDHPCRYLLFPESNLEKYMNVYTYIYPPCYEYPRLHFIYYIYKSNILDMPCTASGDNVWYSSIKLPDECGECILTLDIRFSSYLNVYIYNYSRNEMHNAIVFNKYQVPQPLVKKLHTYIEKQPKYVYCSNATDLSLVNKIATDIATNKHHSATPREYATLLSLLGYNTALTAAAAAPVKSYSKPVTSYKLLQNLTTITGTRHSGLSQLHDKILFRIDGDVAIYVPDDIAMQYYTIIKMKSSLLSLHQNIIQDDEDDAYNAAGESA